MYHHPWTTIWLTRRNIQALGSENQGINWAYQGYSMRSFSGLSSDSSHDSCYIKNNTTVGYPIHRCIIILGPLYHWWGAWFKLEGAKTSVKDEHARDVVWGHAVVCWVIHLFLTFSMPHITLIKQSGSGRIFIHVSSSLDHYTTDEVHCAVSSFWKPG